MKTGTRFAMACLLVFALGFLGLTEGGELTYKFATGNTFLDCGPCLQSGSQGVSGTVNYAVLTAAEFRAAFPTATAADNFIINSFVLGAGSGPLDLNGTVVYLFQVTNNGFDVAIPITRLILPGQNIELTSWGHFFHGVFVDTSASEAPPPLVDATNNLGTDESKPAGGSPMPRAGVSSVGFATLPAATPPAAVDPILGYPSFYFDPVKQAFTNFVVDLQAFFIPGANGEVNAGQTSSLIVYTAKETPTFASGLLYDHGIPAMGDVPAPLAGAFQTEPSNPKISLGKAANVADAPFGTKVTYTYQVTNIGNVPLTNVTILDDNGTPGYPADDFTVGTIPSLYPAPLGQSPVPVTLTATTFPPAAMCMAASGALIPVGKLIVKELSGGDIQATYRQYRSVVDNTYGANAVGYPNGHTFNSLLRSDKVEFRFSDISGAVVLDFFADYISYVGVSPSSPSGYGTRKVTGGDGRMITGSAENVLSVSTSMAKNLNQSPEFYAYTVDSPAPESVFPDWDYVYSYTVVVSKAAFGSSAFGGATVGLVHDSPSKLGIKVITPTPCDSDVSNTATAVGTYQDNDTTTTDIMVTASASAIVHVPGTPITEERFRTFTQGGLGSKPHGRNPGVVLQALFSTVYPSGVTIGVGKTLTFDSASAITSFLPQGGRAGVLTQIAVNPTRRTAAGEFAGQVLALQLNVDFSNEGATLRGLANLKLASGKLAGWTVQQVLDLANTVLGGNTAVLPAGVSLSKLNEVVEKINNNFDGGHANHGFLLAP